MACCIVIVAPLARMRPCLTAILHQTLAADEQQLMQGAGGPKRQSWATGPGVARQCLLLASIAMYRWCASCCLQGKVTQALTRLALGIGPGIVDHFPALYDEFFELQLCRPPKNGSNQPQLVNSAGAGHAKSASPAWPGC